MIYRHYRPVHYSPSSHSALAEAELVYKDDHVSYSVYVSFEIDRKAESMSPVLREIISGEPYVHLLVWTTTPWTLTANMVKLQYFLIMQLELTAPSKGYCHTSRLDLCGPEMEWQILD